MELVEIYLHPLQYREGVGILFFVWRQGSISRGCVFSFPSVPKARSHLPPFPITSSASPSGTTRTPRPWALGTLRDIESTYSLGQCLPEAHSGAIVSSGLPSINPKATSQSSLRWIWVYLHLLGMCARVFCLQFHLCPWGSLGLSHVSVSLSESLLRHMCAVYSLQFVWPVKERFTRKKSPQILFSGKFPTHRVLFIQMPPCPPTHFQIRLLETGLEKDTRSPGRGCHDLWSLLGPTRICSHDILGVMEKERPWQSGHKCEGGKAGERAFNPNSADAGIVPLIVPSRIIQSLCERLHWPEVYYPYCAALTLRKILLTWAPDWLPVVSVYCSSPLTPTPTHLYLLSISSSQSTTDSFHAL